MKSKLHTQHVGSAKARRLCLIASVTVSSAWGCADAGSGESIAGRSEQLSAAAGADAVLDMTPTEVTPVDDAAFSLVVDRGNLIARNLGPIDKPTRVEGVGFSKKTSNEPSPSKGQEKKLAKDLEDRVDQLGAGRGDELQEVVVTFKETRKLPRFRSLDANRGRDTAENVAIAKENEDLVASVSDSRKPDYEALGKSIKAEHGAELVETFWLINGGVVKVPANRLRGLAARGDVQYVEPATTTTPPPANDLLNVRNTLNTNWLYNNVGGYIGLLDTGVRSTHERLAGRLSWVRDCVNGTSSNCSVGSNLDPSDNFWNHGTSTASALSGLTLTNANNQGLTKVLVDSFKVYNNAGLVSAAAVRGFQATVAGGDYVVVAEMQSGETETGAIATAADACYDAGKIVIAANGNSGPNSGTVASPAKAHKVLGVGNWDQSAGALAASSGRGPTTDGRTKPDLMGISIYNAASKTSDTAYQVFTGTSAATPTVAGAMQLWRLWTGTANPGANYAMGITLGDTASGGASNNNLGAGIWKSPNSFHIYGNSTSISQGSQVDFNLPTVSAGDSRVQAAIWWPEGTASHNDVDLQLINPSGTVVSSSVTVNGVFEKVSASAPAAGVWKMRVKGYSVTGTQTVFWAGLRVTN